MRAVDFKRTGDAAGVCDDLADLLATERGEEAVEKLDGAWEELMAAAAEHGFITQSYGGVAVLATNAEYLRRFGADRLALRMRTCDVDVPVGGEAR